MEEIFNKIAQHIPFCAIKDQEVLHKRYQSLLKRYQKNLPIDKGLPALESDVNKSFQRCQKRAQNLPKIEYPENLPIAIQREEIKKALEKHQIIVVCGETGSGKTTQLPKICLEMGRGVMGLIGHTQPRRLAARSVADRIAQELKMPLGKGVGYKMRFDDKTDPSTYVKLMTDGILLNEIQSDANLLHYDTIIIDEAHERSLNIDFLLGYLKRLAEKRADLKIIITSATIDPDSFAKFFNAPIINIPGRSYPVDILYRPYLEEDRELSEALTMALEDLLFQAPGDVLVFLPTERDIHEQLKILQKGFSECLILPLYARLSSGEQSRIFEPAGQTKIILSTNVAETSVTVPGIRYVIDTGTARISRYSAKAKMQRLPIEAISQASANQRAGRCGRVGPGVCLRLYAKDDFLTRPEFTPPEILRTNLASVILQLSALNLDKIEDFPFLDKPDHKLIQDGYKLLHMLGALDDDFSINDLGKILAKIPLDPRLGRILIAAREYACLPEALVLVSVLSIVDPRERPHDWQQASDDKHKRFMDKTSDFLSFLNLWIYYQYQKKQLSKTKLRAVCKKEFLSFLRLQEWQELQQQLENIIEEQKWDYNKKSLPSLEKLLENEELKLDKIIYDKWNYGGIHTALLAGFLDQIGQKDEAGFLGARNRHFHVFPGSGLFKKQPSWIVAAEIAETSKVWGRVVAGIESEWLEPLAQHLIKKQYFEPFWSKKREQVMVNEKILLYGLPIIAKRAVPYKNIDPRLAGEIFIRNALVAEEINLEADFVTHNKQIMQDITHLEAKFRRVDWQLSEEALYTFYQARIPEGIASGNEFKKWLREQPKEHLYLSAKDCLPDLPDDYQALFPDSLMLDEITIALSYHFDPHAENDGVTAHIPLALLKQINEQIFPWLIQGLLEEKIIHLIKSLPKNIRKNFVPVPDVAHAALQELTPYQGNFFYALSHALKRVKAIEVPVDAWQEINIEPYLRFYFVIEEQTGEIMAQGRDLIALKAKFAEQSRKDFEKRLQQAWQRDNVKDWDFEWPESITFDSAGVKLKGYPAIIAEKDSVSLRLLEDKGSAYQASLQGVRKLYLIKLKDEMKTIERQWPNIQSLCLRFIKFGSCNDLKQALLQILLDDLFDIANLPKTKEDFYKRLQDNKAKLIQEAKKVSELVAKILEEYQALQKQIQGNIPLSWIEVVQDINDQLKFLVYKDFLINTPYFYLQQYPRYFQSIKKRLEKASYEPDKDRNKRVQLLPLWEKFKACWMDVSHRDLELIEYRWMLEEWRIQTFSQEIKTLKPISQQRLEKQWRKTQCGKY